MLCVSQNMAPSHQLAHLSWPRCRLAVQWSRLAPLWSLVSVAPASLSPNTNNHVHHLIIHPSYLLIIIPCSRLQTTQRTFPSVCLFFFLSLFSFSFLIFSFRNKALRTSLFLTDGGLAMSCPRVTEWSNSKPHLPPYIIIPI